MPPLLTGMSSGARVDSQANWLLIIFKASQHIKKNFWGNTLKIWFWMLLALLCFSLLIPVGLIMKNLGLQLIQYSKRHRGRLENIGTIENVQAWRRRNLQQHNIQNKQTKNNSNLIIYDNVLYFRCAALWKWIVSVSIMKRQARY